MVKINYNENNLDSKNNISYNNNLIIKLPIYLQKIIILKILNNKSNSNNNNNDYHNNGNIKIIKNKINHYLELSLVSKEWFKIIQNLNKSLNIITSKLNTLYYGSSLERKLFNKFNNENDKYNYYKSILNKDKSLYNFKNINKLFLDISYFNNNSILKLVQFLSLFQNNNQNNNYNHYKHYQHYNSQNNNLKRKRDNNEFGDSNSSIGSGSSNNCKNNANGNNGNWNDNSNNNYGVKCISNNNNNYILSEIEEIYIQCYNSIQLNQINLKMLNQLIEYLEKIKPTIKIYINIESIYEDFDKNLILKLKSSSSSSSLSSSLSSSSVATSITKLNNNNCKLNNFKSIKFVSYKTLNLLESISYKEYLQIEEIITRQWNISSIYIETIDVLSQVRHYDELAFLFKLKSLKQIIIYYTVIYLSTLNQVLKECNHLELLDIPIDYSIHYDGYEMNHKCDLLAQCSSYSNIFQHNTIDHWIEFCHLLSINRNLVSFTIRDGCYKTNIIQDENNQSNSDNSIENNRINNQININQINNNNQKNNNYSIQNNNHNNKQDKNRRKEIINYFTSIWKYNQNIKHLGFGQFEDRFLIKTIKKILEFNSSVTSLSITTDIEESFSNKLISDELFSVLSALVQNKNNFNSLYISKNEINDNKLNLLINLCLEYNIKLIIN